jgi:hypothetical protein
MFRFVPLQVFQAAVEDVRQGRAVLAVVQTAYRRQQHDSSRPHRQLYAHGGAAWAAGEHPPVLPKALLLLQYIGVEG